MRITSLADATRYLSQATSNLKKSNEELLRYLEEIKYVIRK